jgi:PST family polysaccharide transporter
LSSEPSTDDGARLAEYARRARIGRVALAVRTALAQVIILGGTVVLARRLHPAEFGAFAMVQFVLSVLTLVGDAGLGGALVQKKETPTQRELSSVFWAQLALSLTVVAIAWALGELLPIVWPDLPEGAPWILRALAINFVFLSARVVPTLLMERELHFVRVAILDTVNSITFYLVASILALEGMGVWALVIGTLAQGALSFGTAIALRPWRPTFEVDVPVLRGLLGFGIPYQARGGLFMLARATFAVIGGSLLGSHAVGLLNWALENAWFPMTFVDILARVSFPLYSRLQSTPQLFAAEMEKSVRVGASITFFITSLWVGLGSAITEIVFSAQWLEAVPMLTVLAISVVVVMPMFLLSAAFDAIHQPRVVMIATALVALVAWPATAIGTHLAGAMGFACGYAIALASGGVLIMAMTRAHLPKVPFVRPVLAPLVGALVVIACGRLGMAPHVAGPVSLGLAAIGCGGLYLGVIALLDRETFAALRATLPGGPSSAN